MMRGDIPSHIIEDVANRLKVVGVAENTFTHAMLMLSEHVDWIEEMGGHVSWEEEHVGDSE